MVENLEPTLKLGLTSKQCFEKRLPQLIVGIQNNTENTIYADRAGRLAEPFKWQDLLREAFLEVFRTRHGEMKLLIENALMQVELEEGGWSYLAGKYPTLPSWQNPVCDIRSTINGLGPLIARPYETNQGTFARQVGVSSTVNSSPFDAKDMVGYPGELFFFKVLTDIMNKTEEELKAA